MVRCEDKLQSNCADEELGEAGECGIEKCCEQDEHEKCICPRLFGMDHLKEKRLRALKCKKRIRILAQPKHQCWKYTSPVVSRPTSQKIEIIRSYQEQTPVRIRLLAYPKVRKLLSSRNEYRNFVDAAWLKRFDELIQKSLKTMYSRISNVRLPGRSPKIEKWTEKEWEEHMEWISKLANPKKIFYAPALERKFAELEALLPNIMKLAEPKHYTEKFTKEKYNWKKRVPKSSEFTCPERSAKLAEPKKYKTEDEDFEPYQVKPGALTAETSAHIVKLAEHKKYESSNDPNPFQVDPKALAAKASERVIDLAKPVMRSAKDEYVTEPAHVNPKALKAKASKRIIELAQPRVYKD